MSPVAKQTMSACVPRNRPGKSTAHNGQVVSRARLDISTGALLDPSMMMGSRQLEFGEVVDVLGTINDFRVSPSRLLDLPMNCTSRLLLANPGR